MGVVWGVVLDEVLAVEAGAFFDGGRDEKRRLGIGVRSLLLGSYFFVFLFLEDSLVVRTSSMRVSMRLFFM